MNSRRRAGAMLATVLATALAGCGGAVSPNPTGPIPVVATTTIHADLVARVGGGRISVTSIVPKGGEVHTFDPSPQDVARVAGARLIVSNGLGLDDWLAGLARDSGTNAPIVALGDTIPSSDLIVEDGRPNPHVWLDPNLAATFGRAAAEALGQVDPANAAEYTANAEKLALELTTLDDELQARFDAIPPANRTIVSFHDALPYFARAFDLTIVGTIVSAPGQDPSAGELAALIDAIRASGARAVVSEVQFSDELARTVASESGAVVVSDLYTDTLGDPPLDTYEGILRWDVDRLVEALR